MAARTFESDQATHKAQVESLVSRLGEAVKAARGGHELSSKLHSTAVNVLSGKAHSLHGRWEKEAEVAKEKISSSAPRASEFLQKYDDMKAAGIPKVDEFLVTIQNIMGSQEVRAALCGPSSRPATAAAPPAANAAAGAAPAAVSALSGDSVSTTARLQRPPTAPGSREAGPERSSSRRPMLLVDDEAQSSPLQSTPTGLRPSPAGSAKTSNGKEPHAAWLDDHRNPVYGQLGLNSPFKSGADYWRDGDKAEQRNGTADPMQLPPVGGLFNFRGPREGDGDRSMEALPPMPDWTLTRPYLTGQFLLQSSETPRVTVDDAQPLNTYPRAVQEQILLDDLLYAFMGLDGKYVRATRVDQQDGVHISFSLETKADPSLQEIATRMLPICDSVVIMERWAEVAMRYESGRVSHAVAGAMRSLLQDWRLMVTQLEHQLLTGHLTLQAMWYYVQPPLASLSLAASVAAAAASRNLRGAPLLNLLHSRSAAVAGDAAARGLLCKLLRAGCAPYFKTLEQWLCEGVLDDPFCEFMVQENLEVARDSTNARGESAFWYNRYTLRPAVEPDHDSGVAKEPIHRLGGGGAAAADVDVPMFLESVSDTILTTGKYWNVIRECGKPVTRPLPPHVHIEDSPDGAFVQRINQAFAAASAALLSHLTHEAGLHDTLAALKHYFLLARGDLFAVFMDGIEPELDKSASEVSLTRLQSLLELAVRSSSAAGDPHADALTVSLDTRTILAMLQTVLAAPVSSSAATASPQKRVSRLNDRTALKQKLGREVFMMSIKVGWPVSIVVSQSSLQQYQLLMKHLFELELCQRALHSTWRVYQTTRPLFRNPEAALRKAYGLCQQMMHFFHQFRLYLTFEVLEPAWILMQSRIRAASTVDEAVTAHQEFLRRVMKGCLLSRKVKLLQTLISLKTQAYRFAAASARLQSALPGRDSDAEDPAAGRPLPERERWHRRLEETARRVRDIVSTERFATMVNDIQTQFLKDLRAFIAGLEDAHRAAVGTVTETREELDGLLNLIARLDYNNFLRGEPDYQALLNHPIPDIH